MSLKGFPQNIDISPSNWRDLKLTRDFTDRNSGVKVGVGDFKLTREGYQAMEQWISSQGIFESPVAEFTSPSGEQYRMFMSMKTISKGLNDFSCELKMRQDNEHFFEKMEFLSWQLLRNEGFITDDMLVDFPYVNVPDNLTQQKALQIATLLSVLFQIYITVKEIIDVSSLLLNPLNAAAVAAQLVSLGLYLALAIVSLIETLNNLQEIYFPLVRHFKCISDLHLMKASCNREGYTFVSDFMENERSTIYTIGKPDPSDESVADKLSNFFAQNDIYLNRGYPRSYDTGGANPAALFREYLAQYDVDLFIYDGVVRLERSSFFEQNASVNVKPVLSDQSGNDDRFTYNFSELWGRKYFKWSNDENDFHSKEVNKGNVRFEAITTQNNPINEDLVELNGLKELSSPYALVKRKEGYTGAENFIREILVEFQDIYAPSQGVIQQNGGGNPVLDAIATERIGIGIFEKDYWTVTRKVSGTPVLDTINNRMVLRQDENFLEELGQEAINEKFNTGLYVANNTFKSKELKNLPFTDENFVNLLQNNRVNYDGEPNGAKVLKIDWYPYKYVCDVTVELSTDAGSNTTTTIL